MLLHEVQDLLVGTVGQWVIKPLLGVATAATLVPLLCLPSSIGSGIILVSCVSGAQVYPGLNLRVQSSAFVQCYIKVVHLLLHGGI